MKAFVLEEFGLAEDRPLTFTDVEIPSVGDGKVLIKVSACGVCHTDLHTIEGEIRPQLPIIPGHEIVGEVVEVGKGVKGIKTGDRLGSAWLGLTDGDCRYCRKGLENLCENARFTGFDLNGGYAEYTSLYADYLYHLPDNVTDLNAAPLLCAGIIGYRSIKLADVKPKTVVTIFGFGASAHIAIQILVHWGCDVFVFSRTPEHRAHALELGAKWAGEADEEPPELSDSAIIFAPAGPLVRRGLEILNRGGTLSLAGIYMTPIPELEYEKHLYYEKTVRSVTAATREDGRELMKLAEEIPIETDIEVYDFREAPDVLIKMKRSEIKGAGVLRIS